MARAARIDAGLPEFLWPQAVKHTVNVRNLMPKRQLAWKYPHEILGRAVKLPERSILQYTKHHHTFGCQCYDPNYETSIIVKSKSHG